MIGHDYLGSRVQMAGAEYDPSTHRADVQFDVTPGERVHVVVEGAHLWGRTRRKLLPIYQIAGLDPELIQESRENLISNFQAKGYFDVAVQSDVQPAPNGQTILFRIIKGARHKVTEVAIVGNQKLTGRPTARPRESAKRDDFSRTAPSAQRLLKTSTDNLKRVYQAEGFSSVNGHARGQESGRQYFSAIPSQRRAAGHRGSHCTWSATPRCLFPPLRRKDLKVTEGKPYSTKKVDEDRNQIGAQYLRMGYLNANFRATAHARLEKILIAST